MNEQDARIIIDRLLREAGWDIEDKTQVSTEEAAADGRADYLLKDSQGRPLAVIEAKRFSIEPNTAQQRAKEYAESISAPYVFLSNGEIIYFWDYKNDAARLIDSFYSREDSWVQSISATIKSLVYSTVVNEKIYSFNDFRT